MIQTYTFDEIVERMLDRIPDSYDKRESSYIYNAIAPAAAELAQLYIALDWMFDQAFVDTAEREYLILKVKERGIEPIPSKPAIIKIKVSPEEQEIPMGARFNIRDLNYRTTRKLDEPGQYLIECETLGEVGNQPTGEVIPIDYIEGLERVEIVSIVRLGEDEEDTETLRQRYLDSFSAFAYGGNIADYKAKVNQLQGVGGVKVTPTWAGPGTVKLTILDSDYKAPGEDLVKQVQNEVDPPENSGSGYGIAPVGHTVTVEAVEGVSINVQARFTFQEGYTFEDRKEDMQKALEDHYRELSKEWEDKDNVIVRIASIQTVLLSVPRVVDIESLTINGSDRNLILAPNQVPKGGSLNAIN